MTCHRHHPPSPIQRRARTNTQQRRGSLSGTNKSRQREGEREKQRWSFFCSEQATASRGLFPRRDYVRTHTHTSLGGGEGPRHRNYLLSSETTKGIKLSISQYLLSAACTFYQKLLRQPLRTPNREAFFTRHVYMV